MCPPSPPADPLALAADPGALLTRLAAAVGVLLEHAVAVSVRRGEPVYLAGGPVRDALLGRPVRDLDVVVEGDAVGFAHELADRTGGSATVHDEFLTATLAAPHGSLDVITARQESYPGPAKLPVVSPADIGADLARRDFAINALALRLPARSPDDLLDPCGGLQDLRAGKVRVLHARSFADDPTRLLRAVRYEQRLAFTLDAATERLARQAASERLLNLLTGPRLRDELARLLLEECRAAALARLAELGLIGDVLPGALPPEAERRLAELPEAAAAIGRPGLAEQSWAAAAALAADWPESAVAAWADRLGLDRAAGDGVRAAAQVGRAVPEPLSDEAADDVALYDGLQARRDEALMALWLNARSRDRERIRHYARDVRDTKADITGADLLAARCGEGPLIGLGLQAALRAKLAGTAPSRAQQLAVALAAIEAGRASPTERDTMGTDQC